MGNLQMGFTKDTRSPGQSGENKVESASRSEVAGQFERASTRWTPEPTDAVRGSAATHATRDASAHEFAGNHRDRRGSCRRRGVRRGQVEWLE